MHLARPGSRFDCLVERPRPGLVSPPVRACQRAFGHSHRRGEKVLVAPGRQRRWDLWIVDRWLPFHRRFRGYGRCGFRLMGVPRRSASAWSSMCQPRSAPRGAARVPVADLALGNSVGAIGMAQGAVPGHWRRPRRVGCASHPFHDIPAPPLSGVAAGPPRGPALGSYLVDSASSHMLVSKIKPCMSKYKHSFTVKLRMAH